MPAEVPAATLRTRVRIPLSFADGYHVTVEAATFHGLVDGAEHVALMFGERAGVVTPLVRMHSECLTGDVFGSAHRDCGPQLREDVGVVITLDEPSTDPSASPPDMPRTRPSSPATDPHPGERGSAAAKPRSPRLRPDGAYAPRPQSETPAIRRH